MEVITKPLESHPMGCAELRTRVVLLTYQGMQTPIVLLKK